MEAKKVIEKEGLSYKNVEIIDKDISSLEQYIKIFQHFKGSSHFNGYVIFYKDLKGLKFRKCEIWRISEEVNKIIFGL